MEHGTDSLYALDILNHDIVCTSLPTYSARRTERNTTIRRELLNYFECLPANSLNSPVPLSQDCTPTAVGSLATGLYRPTLNQLT